MGLIIAAHKGTIIGSRPNFNKWYGIQLNESNSSPDVTRIAGPGYLHYHATLPVHSQIKACLLNDSGFINYYLNPGDWTKKTDGSPSLLDGSDGQVMMEWPDFYYKIETDTPSSGQHQIKISLHFIPGFVYVPKHYISAYQAALNRTNNKLSSVKNTTSIYRGGNNTAEWDAAPNSLLGKPATNIDRTNFRTYARNRGNGWNQYGYSDHKWLFWLYAIEYATLNSQKTVNATLTAEGYKQGGLGAGVSNANSTEWNNFNGNNPFVNCGASDSLASGSGQVSVTITNFGGSGVNRSFTVPRYRGHENPFGHIWHTIDGVNIEVQSTAAGGQSKLWIADDPAHWNDSNYNNYVNKGLIQRASGYMSKALMGNDAEFVPNAASGSSSTYYCDYYYTSIPGSGIQLRALFVGGTASYGASGGFVFSYTHYTPSYAFAHVGARLRFMAA